MKKIKFRGKNDQGWHYGLLTFMFGSYAISHVEDENTVDLIDKETVTQYTGLKDKNGVEIYEGDICEWHIPDMGRPEPDAMIRYVSAVEYRNGSFNLSGYLFPNVRLIKVLGNIYENPELLEAEKCSDS